MSEEDRRPTDGGDDRDGEEQGASEVPLVAWPVRLVHRRAVLAVVTQIEHLVAELLEQPTDLEAQVVDVVVVVVVRAARLPHLVDGGVLAGQVSLARLVAFLLLVRLLQVFEDEAARHRVQHHHARQPHVAEEELQHLHAAVAGGRSSLLALRQPLGVGLRRLERPAVPAPRGRRPGGRGRDARRTQAVGLAPREVRRWRGRVHVDVGGADGQRGLDPGSGGRHPVRRAAETRYGDGRREGAAREMASSGESWRAPARTDPRTGENWRELARTGENWRKLARTGDNWR